MESIRKKQRVKGFSRTFPLEKLEQEINEFLQNPSIIGKSIAMDVKMGVMLLYEEI